MEYDYPMMRNVEANPVNIKGEPGFMLRDPLNYTSEVIFLPQGALALIQFFDGKRSIIDIQAEFNKHYGEILPSEEIQLMAKELDKHLFLMSERFLKEKRLIDEEFSKSNIRRPMHSGSGYSDDPGELKEEFDSYFAQIESGLAAKSLIACPCGVETAGMDVGSREGTPDRPIEGEISALISPHISINAGGTCFAHTYSAIRRESPADLYVILGIGHAGIDDFFTGTKKDFETPLGIVPTDGQFMDELDRRFGNRLFTGERLHRTEHTVEFQTIFLKYVLKDSPFKIAPILISFPHEILIDNKLDMAKGITDDFISALKETISAYNGKVVIIASVDFAHVGMQYGDTSELTAEEVETVKSRDEEMINIIGRGDDEGFLSHISEDENKRRICGFPAIYTMLRVLDGAKGKLLDYDLTVVDNRNSIVTFAGMAFYDGRA